jgi:2-keto-4-pentenoate hydratase/2-oxohepta-3-ene-1,7-dioic acid hydratase in catechol pathway
VRLVRYRSGDPALAGARLGAVEGDAVVDLGPGDMRAHVAAGGAGPGILDGRRTPLADVSLLAPLPDPGKMLFLGRTFPGYRGESGDADPPFVYVRVASSITGPGEPIRLPRAGARILYEGELAVVIGRRARGVAASAALDHVFGYTQVNDVTWPEWAPSRGEFDLPQISMMKNADTFCPMGPALVTADELDPATLGFRVLVNGEVRTEGTTADLVWSIPEIIAFLSRDMTLEPGDVIALGTPDAQVIVPGDEVTVEFDGLGRLSNPVVDAAEDGQ